MYKQDLALNNLQWFICLKTKPNQTKPKNKKTKTKTKKNPQKNNGSSLE